MLKCKCGNDEELMGFIQEDIGEYKCRDCKSIVVDNNYIDIDYEYELVLDEVAMDYDDECEIEIIIED